MESHEFVEKLGALAPTRQSLSAMELDEEFLDEYLDSYTLEKKEVSDFHPDPILNLILNYDVSNFDVGLIRLNSAGEVQETDRYIIFGNLDADLLGIDKVNENIVMLDWESPEFVMDICAKNSGSFLEAILEVASFNHDMFTNDELGNNQLAIFNKSKEVSLIAGSEEYLSFYLNTFGYTGEE